MSKTIEKILERLVINTICKSCSNTRCTGCGLEDRKKLDLSQALIGIKDLIKGLKIENKKLKKELNKYKTLWDNK